MIDAERAFAARAAEVGWIPAFREYAAPDGQFGNLDSAPEALAALPDDGVRSLAWAPAFAGIARSGEFGFTTGPFSVDGGQTMRGQYFTVWRRQPDGAWRWIWDGGPGPRPDTQSADPAHVPQLAPAVGGAGSAAAAVAAVAALEQEGPAALSRRLATDAQVYRPRTPRAAGAAAPAAFMLPAPDLRFTLMRTEASAAGDLAFTLGEAHWTVDGQERRGVFARIWQHQGQGWRIVYDQLSPWLAPPPN